MTSPHPPDSGRSRILFIDFAPSPGGSIQSLLQILQHLPRDRYDPLVLLSPTVNSLPAWHSLDLDRFSFDARQGTAISSGPATRQIRQTPAAQWLRENRWLGYPWRWGSISRRLWVRTRRATSLISKLIDEQGVDLVHLNDALPLAEPGILAARLRDKPSIVTVRSFTPLDDFHRQISHLPAAGIFTSRPLLEDQRRQGAKFRRERIIYNAIDLKAFAQDPDRAEVRAELGLPQNARVVTVVGRIMRRKGIDIFLEAMARLISENPDLYGLIVGDVEITDVGLDAELQRLAGQLNISDHILFAGHREDVPRLLLASDLLCFVPTLAEPFGRVLVEGMAAGLPVIGARSGAIPDIVVENETGLLVEPTDPEAQAAAIRQILVNPELARQMGEAGRQRASEHFSIERQIAQLDDLYAEVLGL